MKFGWHILSLALLRQIFLKPLFFVTSCLKKYLFVDQILFAHGLWEPPVTSLTYFKGDNKD